MMKEDACNSTNIVQLTDEPCRIVEVIRNLEEGPQPREGDLSAKLSYISYLLEGYRSGFRMLDIVVKRMQVEPDGSGSSVE